MTKTEERTDPGADRGAGRAEVDVLLHGEGSTCKVASFAGTTVREFLEQTGRRADGLLVFPGELGNDDDPDEVDPLSQDRLLRDVAIGRVVTLHCHRCRTVEVVIHYQTQSLRHRFAPNVPVRRVLRWAKRTLKLTDADADNLALFLCDSTEPVREGVHLGELTSPKACEVCFNLSKDVNIEGDI